MLSVSVMAIIYRRGAPWRSPIAIADHSFRSFGNAEPTGRFAIFAAVSHPILLRETFCLCLGGELFRYLSIFLDDHVTALGHGERFFQESKMIEFCTGRMLEGFEPRRMQEVRHLYSIDGECIVLNGVAHFVSVFGTVCSLSP